MTGIAAIGAVMHLLATTSRRADLSSMTGILADTA